MPKAKIIATVSTKGGPGKTTLTANLGGILADMGQRVLMIDADHQASLSNLFPVAHPAPSNRGLYQLLTERTVKNCISRTQFDNLDIIIANDFERNSDAWLRQSAGHLFYLASALRDVDDYDYILIDTKGTDGTGEIQEAAIRAADMLLCPITPEWIAASEFLSNTVHMIARLEPPPGIALGNPIPPMRGIINRIDQTSDARTVVKALRKRFYDESSGKITIAQTVIPKIAAYNKAAGAKIPVHRFEVSRPGPTPSAHDTMLALVYELLPHLEDIQPCWDQAIRRVNS